MKCYCWESTGESAEGLLGLSGTVLMAGSRAVYCEMENKDVLLIHDTEYGTVPFGIGVNNISGLMQKADIKKGMRVATNRNCLDFGRIGIQVRRGMQKAKGAVCPDKPKSPAEIINNIVLTQNLIEQYGSYKGLGQMAVIPFSDSTDKKMPKLKFNVFCRLALPSVQTLTNAVKTDEKTLITETVFRIAGLGPGLTPSGDDFLVGYLMALSYAARTGLEVPPGYQVLKDIFLNGNTEKTSVISNAYLKSAAGGEYFSIVNDVLQAVLIKSNDDIKTPIKRILRIGSSSGTDILCGIIWALQTLPYICEQRDGGKND